MKVFILSCDCIVAKNKQHFLFSIWTINEFRQFDFILGYDSSFNLHFYKIEFTSALPVRSSKISCISGTYSLAYSKSLLSPDSTKIYYFFIYGTTPNLNLSAFLISSGNLVFSKINQVLAEVIFMEGRQMLQEDKKLN